MHTVYYTIFSELIKNLLCPAAPLHEIEYEADLYYY